jgi:hypothetical protein
LRVKISEADGREVGCYGLAQLIKDGTPRRTAHPIVSWWKMIMRLSPAREPGPLTANDIQSGCIAKWWGIFEVRDDLSGHKAATEAVTLAQTRAVAA